MAGVLQQIEDDKALPETKKPTRIPVGAFKFVLRIEGVFDLECRAVRGLRQENEFDYIQEGGVNDYVHALRKPISKPYTFQVERYVGLDNVDYMPIGTEFIIPPMLFVKGSAVVGKTFLDVKNYVFRGAKVIGKDYGDLDAENSKLLVETTTIAYEELIRVGLPNKTGDSDTPAYKTLVDENKTAAKTRNEAAKKAAEEELEKKKKANQETRTAHEIAIAGIKEDWTNINVARTDKYKTLVDSNTSAAKSRAEEAKKAAEEEMAAKKKKGEDTKTSHEKAIDEISKDWNTKNAARTDKYKTYIDDNSTGHKKHNVDRTDKYKTFIDDNSEGITKQKELVGQKYSALTAQTLENYAKRMSEAQTVHPYQDYIDALKK